jgi:hypothetical protein
MMQLMITHLEGNFPLQRMILTYCLSLGTPSSKVMKPLVEATQTMIKGNPDKPADEMTAWRCKPKKTMSNLGHCTFHGFVMVTEMEVLRISSAWENTDPFMLNEKISIYKLVEYSNLKFKYDAMTKKQTNGTPSGRCMRKCLDNYLEHVPHVFDITTLWYFKQSIRYGDNLKGFLKDFPPSIKAEFAEFRETHKRLTGR